MNINAERVSDILKRKEYETVAFEIEGETIEVNILREVKEKHVKEALGTMLNYTEILAESEEIATVYGAILVIEVLTDIEFPWALDAKLDLFLELDEIGLLQKVYEAIGEERLVKFSSELKKAAEEANELFKEVNAGEQLTD